ncbi:MAG: hypothetical protein AAB777_03115 [Patescibacteria group bacterium]
MKNNSSTLARIAVLSGLALGAFALSALADWNNAPPNPPGSNAEAPINVGSVSQTKTGSLIIGIPSSGTPSPAKLTTISADIESATNIATFYANNLLQGIAIGYNTIRQTNIASPLILDAKVVRVVGGPIATEKGLIIETRTSAQGDPASPETGRMWLITN